jgi:hypothetical protein
MMRFELGLEEPDPKRARNSVLTTVVIGGLAATAAFVTAKAVG